MLEIRRSGASHIKPLKGLKGVFEIRSNHRGDTYRTVYALKIDDAVYILHAFKKRSKIGIKTPKQTVDLIQQRLKVAIEVAATRKKEENQ